MPSSSQQAVCRSLKIVSQAVANIRLTVTLERPGRGSVPGLVPRWQLGSSTRRNRQCCVHRSSVPATGSSPTGSVSDSPAARVFLTQGAGKSPAPPQRATASIRCDRYFRALRLGKDSQSFKVDSGKIDQTVAESSICFERCAVAVATASCQPSEVLQHGKCGCDSRSQHSPGSWSSRPPSRSVPAVSAARVRFTVRTAQCLRLRVPRMCRDTRQPL